MSRRTKEERTRLWVHSQGKSSPRHTPPHPPSNDCQRPNEIPPPITDPLTPEVKSAPLPKEVQPISEPAHSQPAIVNERRPPILSSTPKQEISNVLIESFTARNQQLVASLANRSKVFLSAHQISLTETLPSYTHGRAPSRP